KRHVVVLNAEAVEPPNMDALFYKKILLESLERFRNLNFDHNISRSVFGISDFILLARASGKVPEEMTSEIIDELAKGIGHELTGATKGSVEHQLSAIKLLSLMSDPALGPTLNGLVRKHVAEATGKIELPEQQSELMKIALEYIGNPKVGQFQAIR